MVYTSPLFFSLDQGVSLIASSEALFDDVTILIKGLFAVADILRMFKASSINTNPKELPSLLNPTTPMTHNYLHKKTLNLISLSYWKMEREIRLNDALQPLRRTPMMDGLKRHDSLRADLRKVGFTNFRISVFLFFNSMRPGLRVGVVGDDQGALI